MSTEHLEKDIDIYFPEHLREEAKKQLKLLIEIAGLNGEVKAYKQCNQEIREVNQEIRNEVNQEYGGYDNWR